MINLVKARKVGFQRERVEEGGGVIQKQNLYKTIFNLCYLT